MEQEFIKLFSKRGKYCLWRICRHYTPGIIPLHYAPAFIKSRATQHTNPEKDLHGNSTHTKLHNGLAKDLTNNCWVYVWSTTESPLISSTDRGRETEKLWTQRMWCSISNSSVRKWTLTWSHVCWSRTRSLDGRKYYRILNTRVNAINYDG